MDSVVHLFGLDLNHHHISTKSISCKYEKSKTNNDTIDVIGGEIFGWNPGPPLYDSHRNILVHYDTMSATVVATKWSNLEEGSIGKPRYEIIWKTVS